VMTNSLPAFTLAKYSDNFLFSSATPAVIM
jgi:hypothetical protein